jgi:hypothetical protein
MILYHSVGSGLAHGGQSVIQTRFQVLHLEKMDFLPLALQKWYIYGTYP